MSKKEKEYLRKQLAYAKKQKKVCIKLKNAHYAFGFWSGVEIFINEIDRDLNLGINKGKQIMRYIIKTGETYHIEKKNRGRNPSGKKRTYCGLVINPSDRARSIHGHKLCKNCLKKENK